MGFGLAFAGVSFVAGLLSSKDRERKIERAQEKQLAVERDIRTEQAVRERKRQIRTSRSLIATAEARQFASPGTAGGTSLSGVSAGITANLGRNLSGISTGLSQGESLFAARQGVASAGRPSTFDIFAQQAQPLIFSNIDRLDTFFESAFSSDTGTT